MSTFDGFVSEFPHIRIDQFRPLADRPPPLAGFLSHVHSDHLNGLDTLKSPFVYCSPTTREILLRLEKFPHRMNFSRGILESRKQTYKHLKFLLKPIPLETPTMIELSPGNSICVTLFDANHCSGAVMFLIEGQGKAILYTGDVRSEEWWVNNLVRHSKFVLYASGLRKLDKIYLDTTFASNVERRQKFQSKAEGLCELLEKVDAYPEDTVFYFNAWTFGYEDVWLALSQFLNSQVHLDRYRYGIYTSVSKNNGAALECPEAPVLCGFRCGNTDQPGILTRDQTVRLHSCERNTGCPIWDPENASEVVTITPIISRQGNVEVREAGAGGGHGDLNQIHELDLTDMIAVQQLFALCLTKITDEKVLKKIVEMLQAEIDAKRKGIQLEAEDEDSKLDLENIPIDELPDMLAEMAKNGPRIKKEEDEIEVKPAPPPMPTTTAPDRPLPRQITFPYSRHSSHSELRILLAAFQPRDVWPNTFSKPQYFTESMSMETLFGDLCDKPVGQQMAFDREMRAAVAEFQRLKRERGLSDVQRREMQQSQTDDSDDGEEESEQMSLARADVNIHSSSPQPSKPERQLQTNETRHEVHRITSESMQSEKQMTTPIDSADQAARPLQNSALSTSKNITTSISTATATQQRQDVSEQLSKHRSVAVLSKPLNAATLTSTLLEIAQVQPSTIPPALHTTVTTMSTTTIQPTPTPTAPIVQDRADLTNPKTTSSARQPTTSQPAKLTALDDRIAAAFLADDIPFTTPTPLQKRPRLIHSHPLKITSTTTSSPSAAARLAARKEAFEAARSGEWGGKIRLASVQPIVGDVKSAGLKRGEVGSEVHEGSKDVVDGVGEVNREESDEEGEEEEEDVEEEYGMMEAERWGE